MQKEIVPLETRNKAWKMPGEKLKFNKTSK